MEYLMQPMTRVPSKHFTRAAMCSLLTAAALAGALPVHAGEADNDKLLARIVALEQRLGIQSSHLEDAASLDLRVSNIEHKLALQDQAAQAKAAPPPAMRVTEKGISMRSADDGIELKLRGLVQADARDFIGGTAHNDGFLMRRIEPALEGSWGAWLSFHLAPQFAGDSASVSDAYIDLHLNPRATLRIGKAKPPFGLERLQSSASTAQVELGLPSELAPGRDIGVQWQGNLLDGGLDYAIGVFNGAPDGRDAVAANPEGNVDYVGRLFWQPLKHSNGDFGTLGLGVAASMGNTYGSGNNVLPRYRTPGQETFFGYGSNVAADGRHVRKTVQGYWYRGPFGLLGEWVNSAQDVRVVSGLGMGARNTLQHQAWQLAAGWVLTGEEASFRGVVQPAAPFASGQQGWGALELTARYGRLVIDDAAFPLFASTATSAQAARSWGVALNWYLNRNFKLVANYAGTRFDGGTASGVNRPAERVFLTRAQLSF
jgi:phosphate-selective porin OprO/OprP